MNKAPVSSHSTSSELLHRYKHFTQTNNKCPNTCNVSSSSSSSSSRSLTSHSTHYRSFQGRFLQARWPNQQCQSNVSNTTRENYLLTGDLLSGRRIMHSVNIEQNFDDAWLSFNTRCKPLKDRHLELHVLHTYTVIIARCQLARAGGDNNFHLWVIAWGSHGKLMTPPPSLSTRYTHTCTLEQYELKSASCRSINLT